MIILDSLINVDRYIFHLVNDLVYNWMWVDYLGIFFAKYLVYLMLVLLVLLTIRSRLHWRIIVASLGSAVIARGVTGVIRLIHFRERPFNFDHVNLIISKSSEASFPSGHASFAFGLATIVFLHNRKLGVVFLVMASLVSLGRVFVGIHWPLDVLGGAFVGIITGCLVNKVFKKLIKKTV